MTTQREKPQVMTPGASRRDLINMHCSLHGAALSLALRVLCSPLSDKRMVPLSTSTVLGVLLSYLIADLSLAYTLRSESASGNLPGAS